MTFELAMEYNWCGRGNKLAFKDLQVVNIIIGKYSYCFMLVGSTSSTSS
jgi:hypothetical protein